jgi:hypothetical protein
MRGLVRRAHGEIGGESMTVHKLVGTVAPFIRCNRKLDHRRLAFWGDPPGRIPDQLPNQLKHRQWRRVTCTACLAYAPEEKR